MPAVGWMAVQEVSRVTTRPPVPGGAAPHTQCGRSRSGIHVGLGVGDWCVALISPDSRLHPATIKPACLIEYAAADSAAIPSPDRRGRVVSNCCMPCTREAVQIINM